MTSEEAIKDAKASLSAEQLQQHRLSREEWEGTVDMLAAKGIYPDNDPRNNTEGK